MLGDYRLILNSEVKGFQPINQVQKASTTLINYRQTMADNRITLIKMDYNRKVRIMIINDSCTKRVLDPGPGFLQSYHEIQCPFFFSRDVSLCSSLS